MTHAPAINVNYVARTADYSVSVEYVLILTYIATFGNTVLGIATVFASFMVTGMRVFDAITDPIIGALMDKTNGRFGKFRPFMVIGSVIMAVSVVCLYILTPFVPESMMGLRYALFILLYAVWVIGYTFQTSVTRAAQAVLTNDPKQRPLFTIFNTIGSLAGMGLMQFIGPILARDNIFGDYNRSWFAAITPIGICISVLLTILAIIGIWEKDQPKYFGLDALPTKATPYTDGMNIVVSILFCIVPMCAGALTLWSMTGYELDGERVKEIQEINGKRREAVAQGLTIQEAMEKYPSK